MALRYHLATYDPVTYLVGDEIVSGTPTFVHTSTIYAYDKDGAPQSFGANKRVVKGGRYVSDTQVYADNGSGVLLDPLPMTVYQPPAINFLYYSEDISNAYWTKYQCTAATDGIKPNNAVTEASILDTEKVLTAVNTTHTTSIEAKAGTEDWIVLGVSYKNSSYVGLRILGYFDLGTGVVGSKVIVEDATSALVSFTTSIEALDNGYYLCSITWKLNSNRETDKYRNAEIFAAEQDASLELSNANGTDIYTYIRQIQLTATNHTVGPIYTTSANAATDEIINTYPEANWSNSEGPIYLEFDYDGVDANILTLFEESTGLFTGYTNYIISIDQTDCTLSAYADAEVSDWIDVDPDDIVVVTYTIGDQTGTRCRWQYKIGTTCYWGGMPYASGDIVSPVHITMPANAEQFRIYYNYSSLHLNSIALDINKMSNVLYVTSDVLYLDDGTNQTSIACSVVGKHKAGIALDASGGNMRLNLDGTWAD